MTAFGIPFGVVFGMSIGNMAFLRIGIPVGFLIGIAIRIKKDKKTLEEGRQLELEIQKINPVKMSVYSNRYL